MAKILDGAALAKRIKSEVHTRALGLKREPGLAVILVGDDLASSTYVRSKMRDCQECGIFCKDFMWPADTTTEQLLTLIHELNDATEIDGILVQLPLPDHIDQEAVLHAISPSKDVDGFTPENAGLLSQDAPCFLPCTPAGICEMLAWYDIPILGRHCVIVGRSNIVGKPLAQLMLSLGATVTVCHSCTQYLAAHTSQADILVSAVGKPGFITRPMVKLGAVVVDVGINRLPDGKLCGDVCFEEVEKVASYITPVPGGVGPLTRARLMYNVEWAARQHQRQRGRPWSL